MDYLPGEDNTFADALSREERQRDEANGLQQREIERMPETDIHLAGGMWRHSHH